MNTEKMEEFLTDIIKEYGEQTFVVKPADLLFTLTDIHFCMERYGLRESLPFAMAELLGKPTEEGEVEVIVRWLDKGGFLVGVYPIFTERR